MHTTLAIAGCGPRLEVALDSSQLTAPALVALAGATPRSDLIVAAIDLLFRSTGLDAEALELVVATRGPGSFTGIRVALATALGLASARGAAGHGFSSLEAQAARTGVRPCLAVQPARRGFVFAQRCDGTGATSAAEIEVVALSTLAAQALPVIAPAGLELPAGVTEATAIRTTAEALLELARKLARPDPSTLTPLYVEPPQAVAPAPPTPPWQPSRKAS